MSGTHTCAEHLAHHLPTEELSSTAQATEWFQFNLSTGSSDPEGREGTICRNQSCEHLASPICKFSSAAQSKNVRAQIIVMLACKNEAEDIVNSHGDPVCGQQTDGAGAPRSAQPERHKQQQCSASSSSLRCSPPARRWCSLARAPRRQSFSAPRPSR
eukprot:3282428-Pleurochrysis_carterae.AAC.1